MKLKKQLELYIEEYDLSVTKLAKKSSVPKQTIHNWISDSRSENVNVFKWISSVRRSSQSMTVPHDQPIELSNVPKPVPF